ncbi:cysteine-rich receptor-like protein kinase 10 [Chenopodium quinoa]|uniref:cysteine-rich receptor-like protein kinase 10 n=1 Tax=Chenopodium quinoa TaxID=63459 RepID=UPI000B77F871|nr:cysteine-rich receptor-like protein kinase 10 [Chenopodium quinoa]
MEDIAGLESLQFEFKAIKAATDNFSPSNKLGQGGFGVVYKGKLQDEQEIAVKRLSIYSGQGISEFKTEILLAAKLQHNNLAKLLGFSLHGEEKLLIYELLPNASLDKVLFGQNKVSLDWETRYKILLGTARGLLYLHEDSRLKIIHRDLKSSNILLDETMNPKIADFGLARLVGRDQIHADTSKIAGTYGYMAPEYALTGRFSVMSDVYSFGIIALEIISGHMCSSIAFPYHDESLPLRAWSLWKSNSTLDLVDPRLYGKFPGHKMERCIHISLLCIQEDSNKRPTMATIVSALNGHQVALSEPEPPLIGPSTNITFGSHQHLGVSSSGEFLSNSDNITEVYPRLIHSNMYMKRQLFLSTLILGVLSQLYSVYAVVVFEYNWCSSSYGNYTQGSVYHQNLNHLFSNLSSQTLSRRFYNTTSGEFPNKVYGIYQCREDFTLEVCNQCIDDATQKITEVCPLYVESIVWYDECMLRYANRSIFSLSETSPSDDAWYTDTVSNYEEFVPVIEKTTKTIISQAARTSARGHFASMYANYTSIHRVYNFAMCTPDINELDCKNCLSIASKKLSTYYNESKGVTSFFPSCQLGYDTAINQMTHVPLTPDQAQAPGQPPNPAPTVTFEVYECSSKYGNYTNGSAYQLNLNRLFSSLSTKTSTRRFYNTTIGDFPSKVYAIYQCREDLGLDICSECIKDATKTITQVCPFYSEGIVWYDECMLRYANRSIFSLSETYPSRSAWYDGVVSNYDKFGPLVEKTMNNMVTQAASVTSRGHFANTYVDWTSIDRMYCFAMCTRDIDEFDCKNCLSTGITEISGYYNRSKGVTVFYPSCQLGYDTKLDQLKHVPLVLAPAPAQAHAQNRGRKKKSSHIVVAISVPLILAVLLLSSAGFCVYCHKRKTPSPDEEIVGVESLQFNFKTIRDATDNFSEHNKLGQGGFGRVYKGKLQDGQEIAVKRLSTCSGQGSTEFKTEILLAAKLQHNNLVKLLGFCIHGEEKLLVYELLPNASIDKVLFGQNEHPSLDWEIRFKILLGTARGLLYLHEDSRLKIIHRDLKPSNILLDEYMNPKISDFGLARLVGREQMHVDTSKVAGTYGYMAPEYALTGRFSVMSDVYSFGVITLEVVSGHMCSSTVFPYHEDSLLIRAWNLWKDNAILDLVDPRLYTNYSTDEMKRCIHLGLLCIQEDANKRPTMATIVSALNGHKVALSEPEPPLIGPSTNVTFGLNKKLSISSSNEFHSNIDDITEVYPR